MPRDPLIGKYVEYVPNGRAPSHWPRPIYGWVVVVHDQQIGLDIRTDHGGHTCDSYNPGQPLANHGWWVTRSEIRILPEGELHEPT